MACQECGSDKRIAAKGLCYACYMRDRRAHGGPGRRPNGATLAQLLSYKDQSWRRRVHDFISRSPDGRGCLHWVGPKTRDGYGVVSIAGLNVLGHRAVFAFSGGDPEVEVVMHTCDNPSCCNPEHLVGGTYKENMDDMAGKGRRRGGNADHLRDRKRHPRARRVVTPVGEFASAALAAEAVGLHYKTVLGYLQRGERGYSWLDVEDAD